MSFGESQVEPEIRTVGELSSVLLQPGSVEGIEKEPAYLMYRNLAKNKKDEEKIVKAKLRYDITKIPPRKLGIEYVKTLGHMHPNVPKTKVAYPELYQVLSGKAHYILQKTSSSGEAEDVVVVEARGGEMVLIPPGYGHITVNPKGVDLVMANWVSTSFKSDYSLIEEMRGAAYYETVENNWILNDKYDSPAPLRRRRTTDAQLFGLEDRADMYALVEDLTMLDALVNPQKHEDSFRGLP